MLKPAINGYVCGYQDKKLGIYANTLFEAKKIAVTMFKPPKSKQHLISAYMAQLNVQQVQHYEDACVLEAAAYFCPDEIE